MSEASGVPGQRTESSRTNSAATGGAPGARLAVGTLIAGCLAVCLAQIGIAIPATLNGLFQSDLHPIGSQLTWISDAFLLPVSVLELTFGVLGDLFGRKRLLVGGALLMVAGEVVAAAAPGVHVLWVGQALAGLGAAALFPTSLAMLAAGTHTHAARARVIALWAALLSTGGFLAPLLGGITGNYGSWRWSFIVVAIIAALSTVVSALLARDSRAPQGRSLDPAGQVTIGLSLFALLFAVIQGPTDGWGSGPVVIGFVLFAVFMALFVLAELRARNPLLRLDLFRNRAFATASVVAVVGMFAFLGTAYDTSIRMGPIQHQSTLRTAVAFLLLNGLTIFLTPLTSQLMARLAPRWVLGLGFALMAAGDFIAAGMPVGDRTLTSLILPLGLVGVGFSFAVSSITATAVNTVPVPLAGMASATTSLLRDFGFTLGPAVVGAIALSNAASRFGHALGGSALPAQVKAAAGQVAAEGGPLAVNSVPPNTPPGQAAPLAVDALGHGYALGYVVCGCAALLSCLLTVAALRGHAGQETAEEEAEEAVEAAEASTGASGAAPTLGA
ncbi:MFS transporter [Phaeacidiphilus oryzae]|uniref:MFS transporter n=1 Tax=Phaeacidiphilus oryzae TaxID=348818 RepID=UPI00068F65EA|nr:MFS transporter [Phaeacidiphilus oryzae]